MSKESNSFYEVVYRQYKPIYLLICDAYLSKSEFELFKVKLISVMLLDNILLSSFCTALRPETVI